MDSPSESKSPLRYVAGLFWNFHEHRLRALWRLCGAVAFIIVPSILLGVVFALLGTSPELPSYVGQLQTNLVGVVAIGLAIRLLDRRRLSEAGMRLDKDWWSDLAFGLVLGALLWAVIFLVELAAGWISIGETFRNPDPGQPFVVAILLPVLFYLSVGIAEELAFRGYLLRNLAEGLNLRFIGPRGALVLAWLLTSALFGIAHLINPGTGVIEVLNITLAGLWLGLGYVLTGRLAISMGTHITFNFFAGNVFGFPVSGMTLFPTTVFAIEQGGPEIWTGGEYGPGGGLLGLFTVALGILLVVIWVRIRHGQLALLAATRGAES